MKSVAIILVTAALACLLGACVGAPVKPVSTRPPPSIPTTQTGIIAQVEFGQRAHFVLCQQPACPAVTVKTMYRELEEPPRHEAPTSDVLPILSPGTVTVLFEHNSALLDATARRLLETMLPSLSGKPLVRIEGYTDDTGSRRRNAILANQRADAVTHYLATRVTGLSPWITKRALPACCYSAGNETAAERARNRRAVVTVTGYQREAAQSSTH